MKSLLRNPYNFKLTAQDKEHPKGKSLTVQNDALSVKEILEKWVHGVDPMLTKNGEYLEDPDHDDPDMHEVMNLDITDRAELSARASDTFEQVKQHKERKKKEKDSQQDDQAKDA